MCDELKAACGTEGCEWQGERGWLGRHWAGDCIGRQHELATKPDELGLGSSDTPIECPYCLVTLAPTGSLPSHLLDCEIVPMPCPFASHGCPTRLSRAQLQLSHLTPHHDQPCAFQPLQAFLSQFDRLEDENRTLRARCDALEDGMREMRAMMEAVQLGMGDYWVGPEEEAGAGGGAEGAPGREEGARHSAATRLPTPTQSRSRPTLPPSAFSNSSASAVFSSQPNPPPLPSVISSHTTRLASLDSSLSALDARHTQARTDATHALRSEMHDLRQGLLAVRAQVMHLHIDQARRDAMQRGGGGWAGPLRGLGGRAAGEEGEEGGSASGSDDETGGFLLGRGYGGGIGVGMGMGMGMMDGMGMGMVRGMGGIGPRFGMFHPSPPLGAHGRSMYPPPGLGGGIKL